MVMSRVFLLVRPGVGIYLREEEVHVQSVLYIRDC